MDRDFERLDDNEVLHVRRGRIVMENPTFRVSEFLDALAQAISEQEGVWSDENEGWFEDGLDCEVLRLSSRGWQRGRVRIRLEFLPAAAPKLLKEAPRGPRPENRMIESPQSRRSGRPPMERDDYAGDQDMRRSRPIREDIYASDDNIYDVDVNEVDY